MTPTDTSTLLVDQWAMTVRQLARDWAALANPAAAGAEEVPGAAVRGMHSVVNDVLDLERVCIDAWRERLPAGDAAWAPPRVSVVLAATALEARARLWQHWLARVETASRAGVGEPAGELEWPPASPERGASGVAESAAATGRTA